jgi:tRNA(fMet)-specific endonuclease VapC
MKKIVVDTNAYSRLMVGDTDVFEALGNADTVYMSVFVLGELFAGFRGGVREAENRNILKQFLGKPTVKIIMASPETADIFGWLKHQLKQAGTPIPINDVWIAAHTIETGSTLMTFDSHFDRIPGLRLWPLAH